MFCTLEMRPVGVSQHQKCPGVSVTTVACRDKEHSTIIYESPQPDTPLLRLGWNKQDPRYMATILMDSSKVVVLDIRCALLLSSLLANNSKVDLSGVHASSLARCCCWMLSGLSLSGGSSAKQLMTV